VFVVLLLAVAVISAPLRRGSVEAVTTREEARREELVAARDAKYREIRDAEMDFRTSKLSEADWREIDRVLRGEAVEILRGLDELEA
jgi:hypothetical protein